MSVPSSWRRPLVIFSVLIASLLCVFHAQKNRSLTSLSNAQSDQNHPAGSARESLSGEESVSHGINSQELPTKSSDRNDNGARNSIPATAHPTVTKALTYAAPVAQSGQKAEVEVTVGKEKLKLSPNQLGVFQRVNIPLSAKVPVTIHYPNASEGDSIVIESEDGGLITEAQRPVFVGQISSDKRVAFQFEATAQQGIFRISLRQGVDVKQLEFWAGEPLPYASALNQ